MTKLCVLVGLHVCVCVCVVMRVVYKKFSFKSFLKEVIFKLIQLMGFPGVVKKQPVSSGG